MSETSPLPTHHDFPPATERPRDGSAVAWWAVALLALIALPAPTQLLLELWRGEKPAVFELFERPPSEQHLRAVEDELENASWWVGWARRHWARGVDRVFDRGGRRVVFGRRDWLFYRPGVELVAGPALGSEALGRRFGEASLPGTMEEPRRAILDFHHQLAERGIELVLLPVPVKATAYPEFLWAGADPLAWPDNPGVEPLLSDLRQAGVKVVDVDSILRRAKAEGELIFMPRDTHWSPQAMRRVAEATADVVRADPALAAALGPAEPFDRRQMRFAGWGDLVGMLGYGHQGAADPVAAEERASRSGDPSLAPMAFDLTQVLTRRDGHRAVVGSGSPVLLLGDSLTQVYSRSELGMGRGGGFGEHLADALGLPIEVIAQPAGGSRRTREALALAPARLAGKRVVVWQLTRRDLLWGEWPLVEIPPLPEGAEAPEITTTVRRTVAWVVQASRLPRELDYRDCLTIVRYRRIEGDAVPGEGRDFFVAHVGWSDFSPTEAAGYVSGDVHALELIPLPAEHTLENSCWVDTVGLDQQPWWAVRTEVRSDKNLAPTGSADVSSSPDKNLAPTGSADVSPAPDKNLAPVGSADVSPAPDKNLAPLLAAARRGEERWRSWLERLKALESETSSGEHLVLAEGESRSLWDAELGGEILRLGEKGEGPIAVIEDFSRQLEAIGVELILVPVPPRAALVPELVLAEGVPEGPEVPRPDRWRLEILVALEERGLEILDPMLIPGLVGEHPSGILRDDEGEVGTQGFFRTQDPHWTHWGSSQLADALAQRLRNRPWWGEVERTQGRARLVDRKRWRRMPGPIARRLVQHQGEDHAPAPERFFEHVTRVAGERWTFSDRGSPILLLGDSFTAREHGLPDALLRELGFRVDQVTVAGGLPVAGLEALSLRREESSKAAPFSGSLHEKRLVIWVFTTNAFHHPERWEKIEVVRPPGIRAPW